MSQPLMPRATAVWLIDRTALTFDQIAEFCHGCPLFTDRSMARRIFGALVR